MTEFEKYFKERYISQEIIVDKLQDQIKELVINGEDLESHIDIVQEFVEEAAQILILRNLYKKMKESK